MQKKMLLFKNVTSDVCCQSTLTSDFCLIPNVYTVSGAHPVSYSVGTGVISQG